MKIDEYVMVTAGVDEFIRMMPARAAFMNVAEELSFLNSMDCRVADCPPVKIYVYLHSLEAISISSQFTAGGAIISFDNSVVSENSEDLPKNYAKIFVICPAEASGIVKAQLLTREYFPWSEFKWEHNWAKVFRSPEENT